ncbi:MAG: SDR family NAD(P)-dependent oxidoreductase, partial [Pseudomonadota bacterium]
MAETVIITGASRGIGQALVRRHVDRGDRVFGFDREPAPDGSAAGWFEVDVSDTDAVERATQSVWDTSGGVDRVYANAGIGLGVPLLKATPDQF